MPVQLTPEQAKILSDLKMSYRFVHTAPGGADPSEFMVECELMDLVTDTKIEIPAGPVRAESEQEAVNKAIALAPTADRPRTPAQLVADNAEQRKRIEELEARLGKGQKPAPSKAGSAPTAG